MRPIDCATSSAGAPASMNFATPDLARLTRQRPTVTPRAIPPPDSEPAFPDGEWPPPRVRHLVPAGHQVVEAPPDQARGEAPQRDLVNERRVAVPATLGDHYRDDEGDREQQAVYMDWADLSVRRARDAQKARRSVHPT